MCQSVSRYRAGKVVCLDQAVGTILAHDLTEVKPGCFKGASFKKGHVIKPHDLPHLAQMGKRHLYVLDVPPGMLHEDEAALLLANALAGEGVTYLPNPSEGKISLVAARDGLFKVNTEALTRFNLVDGVMCASRHTNTVVHEGEVLAGTRAIPLIISRSSVDLAVAEAAGGVFSVGKMTAFKTALIITGQEVYSGLIKDRFADVLRPKLEQFGCIIQNVAYAPDDADFIAGLIGESINQGAELLVLSGGLSVDPDDVTFAGVQLAGATEMVYGAAVLPGAMLLIAQVKDVPIIGVPACGLFHHHTIFDLVLPRILAGEKITRLDLAAMAHGGLCLNCTECRFPVCPFGKGG
ncbi:MAG: molybdopterin-binding protein [Deltaproteobacteria bacterium]|nr:molybdopterin-binding protein [Deltaproteobacteria bacterium]